MTCLSARGVPVQMAGCPGSVARRRAEARCTVRANIRLQATAGGVTQVNLGSAFAHRA